MTPTQIEDSARLRYNSSGSSFYSSAEVLYYIYQAECEMYNEAGFLSESIDTSGTTTAGTGSYAFPSGFTEIRRVEIATYGKLKKISMTEDDALTLDDPDTTDQGNTLYYFVWNKTIYFRPIPDTSDLEIKVYGYVEPTLITSGSQVLEIPTHFHMDLVDKVVAELAIKDGEADIADRYQRRWEEAKKRAKRWVQKQKRRDAFATVKDEEALVGTILGQL